MWRKWLLWLGLALVLAAVNTTLYQREHLLAHGTVLRLALAPVDPRSLLQGDYMALHFAVAVEAAAARAAAAGDGGSGLLVLALDARGVGRFRRFHAEGTPLAVDEHLLRYRVRNGQLRLGTDAFFFEEGQGGAYAAARFGEFRLAADGTALLTTLLDEHLAPLGREAAAPR